MGHFQVWGLIKPRIWTSVITCNLVIAETLHSNKYYLARVSPLSTEKAQLVCCKLAWALQMAPDVSECHTQQFCGWGIAYKRLGPPGTMHVMGYPQEPHLQRIGIFASNSSGISGGHSQELLQKHHDVITWTQTMRNQLRRFTLRARRPYRPAAKLYWVTVQRRSFSICLTQDFPTEIKCSPYTALVSIFTVLHSCEHRRGTSLIAR